MQFLAIAQPNMQRFSAGLPADFEDMLVGERSQARKCYLQGSLRQIWEKGEGRGAVAIFEADDRITLDAILASFPLVAAGYVEYQVIALVPYGGFGEEA